MIITLAVLYYLYLLIVLFFILGGLVNIYHLLRFGFTSTINILVIVIFVGLGTLILMYSWELMQNIDWTIPLLDFKTTNMINENIFY